MTDVTRACVDCGADISERHHNAKRCRPCSAAASAVATGTGTRSKPCAVDDGSCCDGRLKRGMCELHYRRLRLRGTTAAPEAIDHLTRYVEDENGCWLWTGPMFWNGYGHISAATHGTTLAHRASYEAHVGPVPEGLELDHLCRVRHCIRPDHLEPVTRSVNIQRGVDARKAG